MFVESIASDELALRQGDVVLGVPIPVIDENARLAHVATHMKVLRDEANDEQLARCDKAILPLYRGPALILSQCCDLEDTKPAEQLLVAPIVSDSNQRFRSSLGRQASEALQKDAELFLATVLEDAPRPWSEFKNNEKLFQKKEHEQLKKLWLGDFLGAFPIAASGDVLERGICFFDGIVGLPRSWRRFVVTKRVQRLKPEWRMVLQEALREWMGRYAFPGTNADRLRAGGLDV